MDKELLYDTRLVRRWIAKGMLTPDELEAHLDRLPDCQGNAENIEPSRVDHAGVPAE